jgi:purine-nucleoside phosphorylase
VPEAIVAAHGGMKVLALSCITNMAAGMLDQPLNHLEVLEVGLQAADRTIALLSAILNRLEKA